MKIGPVLAALHRSEIDLYHELVELSQRYPAEHEVHHVARDIAQWSQDHVKQIAEIAGDYDQQLEPVGSDVKTLKRADDQTYDASFGIDKPAGLALLWDLRSIHMAASGIAMQWTMLSQGAQALHQDDLLNVVNQCQAETQRQQTWAKAQIKQLSPQVLSS